MIYIAVMTLEFKWNQMSYLISPNSPRLSVPPYVSLSSVGFLSEIWNVCIIRCAGQNEIFRILI